MNKLEQMINKRAKSRTASYAGFDPCYFKSNEDRNVLLKLGMEHACITAEKDALYLRHVHLFGSPG